MFLHGGHAVVLEPGKGSWSLETEPGAVMDGTTVEHIIEAARVLARYADAIAVRAFPRGEQWEVARSDDVIQRLRPLLRPAGHQSRVHSAAPVPGAGRRAHAAREAGRDPRASGSCSPGPGTPRRCPPPCPPVPRLRPRRWAWRSSSPGPMATSWTPKTPRSSAASPRTRRRFVHIINDPDDALVGADAVYAKSWGSVRLFGQPDEEARAAGVVAGLAGDGAALRSTRGGKGIVMHCLPVRRNVEIDDAVLDGPQLGRDRPGREPAACPEGVVTGADRENCVNGKQ